MMNIKIPSECIACSFKLFGECALYNRKVVYKFPLVKPTWCLAIEVEVREQETKDNNEK